MVVGGKRISRKAVGGLLAAVLAFGSGCRGVESPLPDGALIRRPLIAPAPIPVLGPPAIVPAAPLAKAPVPPATGTLGLDEVLANVSNHFPLLLAIQEQRALAGAQRLAAEGAYDFTLKSSFNGSEGSFGNTRFDLLGEQAVPNRGASFFAGYRTGLGDFPVYNLGQKTNDGGEFRAGFQIPLLRDGPIDARRAAVRQAQIAERLADPNIRRARLDYFRTASRTYWFWVAAGQQYRIAKALYDVTEERQKAIEKQVAGGVNNAINSGANRQALLERETILIAAERAYQRAALDLSLFHRDANGDPIIPKADRLPSEFPANDPLPVGLLTAEADVATALATRPELERFQLEKESIAVDLKLASNRFSPMLNFGASAFQDLGPRKSSFTGSGIFESDTYGANLFANFELPVQRRAARGEILRHQARLRQVLENERYAQNTIRNEVLDALNEMDRAFARLRIARLEQKTAETVVELEAKRYEQGNVDILALNLREFAAAQSQSRVAAALADYCRGYAEYLAATGREGAAPKIEKQRAETAEKPLVLRLAATNGTHPVPPP